MNLQNVIYPLKLFLFLLFADIPGSQGPDPTFPPAYLLSFVAVSRLGRKKKEQ